jgi:unsaturated pyranuronate lyase
LTTQPTGHYTSFSEAAVLDAGDGVTLRPVAGEALMISQVAMPANVTAAVHTHTEEKIGVVLSGTCEFTLGGVTRTLGPGDIYHVPAGVAHGPRTLDDECILLDVFSPPRPDLLERIADLA